ncbi:hypothetical protein SGPA1_11243 [Streptomyces misionensis JCM 4497]
MGGFGWAPGAASGPPSFCARRSTASLALPVPAWILSLYLPLVRSSTAFAALSMPCCTLSPCWRARSDTLSLAGPSLAFMLSNRPMIHLPLRDCPRDCLAERLLADALAGLAVGRLLGGLLPGDPGALGSVLRVGALPRRHVRTPFVGILPRTFPVTPEGARCLCRPGSLRPRPRRPRFLRLGPHRLRTGLRRGGRRLPSRLRPAEESCKHAHSHSIRYSRGGIPASRGAYARTARVTAPGSPRTAPHVGQRPGDRPVT